MNKQALQLIIKSRSKLMRGQVGMASMLLHLEPVEVTPTQCPTMATDGKRIIYNPEFVLEQTEMKAQSLLVHEALHVVWEHPLRRGNRHHIVWNYACDYAINGFMLYEMKMDLPDGGLWSRDYNNMSAESIYAILIKNEEALQDAIDNVNEGNSGDGDSNDDTSTGDDSGNGGDGDTEPGDIDNISETGQLSSPSTETGQTVGDIDLDTMPMPQGEVWDAQTENGEALSDSDLTELRGEIQRAVSLSDKLEKAMSTSGTSSLRSRIEEMKDNQVNWNEALSDFLESTYADDHSWSQLNRRHQWRGIYLPSKAKSPQGGELAISIDVSTSVDQGELNQFASYVQAIAEECGLDKIRVCYCDTVVRKNADGEWWDKYDLDEGDELKLKIRGGGGTLFNPPFNLINDYTDDADDIQALIYFTDGWGEVSPEVEPQMPVVWCCTDKSHYSERLPFGEVIYVDKASLY